ncbi:hypothetical protein [Streptomyces echinatus]|uniref:hypothetical protein n=1 Tax=Streptomyces echinatus TaxID=67293 RepID=UPI003CD06E49
MRWRYATLDEARERAAQLGLAGAAFPWRTIAGTEGSAYWRPAPPPSTGRGVAPDASIHGTSSDHRRTHDFERETGVGTVWCRAEPAVGGWAHGGTHVQPSGSNPTLARGRAAPTSHSQRVARSTDTYTITEGRSEPASPLGG